MEKCGRFKTRSPPLRIVWLDRNAANSEEVEEHCRTRKTILEASKISASSSRCGNGARLPETSQNEEIELQQKVDAALLNYLGYRTMSNRYESVLEAYPDTFDWAFEGPREGQPPWSNLIEWLSFGTSIYWINGKAGSGKSTLMKHIYEDPRTREYLNSGMESAAPSSGDLKDRPLTIATFFFWNSGTSEQKSQIGLLRGLLYQILTAHPILIPLVLPDNYARIYSQFISRGIKSSLDHLQWPLRQLMSAIRAVVEQNFVPLRLFLMIDGLDEFEGDHEEMAGLFKSFAQSTRVKILLSSRPWQVFSDSFNNRPSLRLQDLTYPDIYTYVEGKFTQSEAFQRMTQKEPTSARTLVREVVERANGVFLWVRIVVGSLLRGINNRDDFGILQERLRVLPQELKGLYDHLMSLMDPLYKPWASMAFQLVRTFRDVHAYDRKLFSTSANKEFTLLAFVYATDEGLYIDATKALAKESILAKCENAAVLLNVRCLGFLESGTHTPDSPIEYMHRTVREFLEGDDYWSEMLTHTAGSTFNSHVSLMRNYALWITFTHPKYESPRIAITISLVLLFAYFADLHVPSRKDCITTLDTLDRLRKEKGNVLAPELDFLQLATRYSLTGYIEHKLQNLDPEEARKKASSLRDLISLQDRTGWPEQLPPFRRAEVTNILLQYSCPPEQKERILSKSSDKLGDIVPVSKNGLTDQYQQDRITNIDNEAAILHKSQSFKKFGFLKYIRVGSTRKPSAHVNIPSKDPARSTEIF